MVITQNTKIKKPQKNSQPQIKKHWIEKPPKWICTNACHKIKINDNAKQPNQQTVQMPDKRTHTKKKHPSRISRQEITDQKICTTKIKPTRSRWIGINDNANHPNQNWRWSRPAPMPNTWWGSVSSHGVTYWKSVVSYCFWLLLIRAGLVVSPSLLQDGVPTNYKK